MRKQWLNPANGRYYQIELYQDLLCDWILHRQWCGKSNRGNAKKSLVQSYQEGLHQVSRIERVRTRHGYRLVG